MMNEGIFEKLAEFARQWAKEITVMEIHKLKHAGLNRANRRRMSYLKRRGRLAGNDIPLPIVLQKFSGNI